MPFSCRSVLYPAVVRHCHFSHLRSAANLTAAPTRFTKAKHSLGIAFLQSLLSLRWPNWPARINCCCLKSLGDLVDLPPAEANRHHSKNQRGLFAYCFTQWPGSIDTQEITPFVQATQSVIRFVTFRAPIRDLDGEQTHNVEALCCPSPYN